MEHYCYECKSFSYDVMGAGICTRKDIGNKKCHPYVGACYDYFVPKEIQVGDYVELDTTEIVRVQEVLDNGFIAYEGGVSNKFKKL